MYPVFSFHALKEITKAYKVITLNQVHSDRIFVYDGDEYKQEQGDAIITAQKKMFIGVKTADCLPIMLLDKKQGE
jgi:hypothetical protein